MTSSARIGSWVIKGSCLVLLLWFVSMQFSSKTVKTSHIKDSIAPFWDEKLSNNRSAISTNEHLITGKDKIEIDESKCSKPQYNVFFLKTHKTASTALTNLLYRYADENNLYIGLPKIGGHVFNYPYRFKRTYVKEPINGTKINMIINHMKFDYSEVKLVMPPNTTFLTILRDPATQFESAFNYFYVKVPSFIRAGPQTITTLERFISNTSRYFKGPIDKNFWFVAKNFMSYDLGFNNMNESDEYIAQVISKMEQQFHFVVMAENFEMSMLLLRDKLCWNMEDIVSFMTNSRKKSTIPTLSLELSKKIRTWNKLDWAIYDHYNKTFWRRIKEYGEDRMKSDLKALEVAKKLLSKVCFLSDNIDIKNIQDKNYKVYKPVNVEMTGFLLRPSVKWNPICQGIARPEKLWIQYLEKKQKNRTKIAIPIKQVVANVK